MVTDGAGRCPAILQALERQSDDDFQTQSSSEVTNLATLYAIFEKGVDRPADSVYIAAIPDKSVPTVAKSKGVAAMLDYRLHYAIMVAEDRVRGTKDHSGSQNRGIRRIFRVNENRPAGREMGRR